MTDRGFYLFQERGDLLGDEYGKNTPKIILIVKLRFLPLMYTDKLEMSQFRSFKVNNDTPVNYMRLLPPFKSPYTHLIEMYNRKT